MTISIKKNIKSTSTYVYGSSFGKFYFSKNLTISSTLSIGEGNGTPLQYSCLENPMDGEEPGGLQSMGSYKSDMTEQLHFHFSLSCIGEGNGNPLQCSCLENPRDGRAWWAAVWGSHGVGHDWSDLAAAAGIFVVMEQFCICWLSWWLYEATHVIKLLRTTYDECNLGEIWICSVDYTNVNFLCVILLQLCKM